MKQTYNAQTEEESVAKAVAITLLMVFCIIMLICTFATVQIHNQKIITNTELKK